MIKVIVAVLMVIAFPENSSAVDLNCTLVSPKPNSIKQVTIRQIDEHSRAGSYLEDMDAKQYDVSFSKRKNTILLLNNGCDNSFRISFPTRALSTVLDKKATSLSGTISYAYPSQKEDGTDTVTGQSAMSCQIVSGVKI